MWEECGEGNRDSKEMLKHKEAVTQSEKRYSLVLVFDIYYVCVGAYVMFVLVLMSKLQHLPRQP